MSTTNVALQTVAADAQIAVAALTPLAPLLGPNAAAASLIATALTNALNAAAKSGDDLTDADFEAALAADDAAKADDLKAQADALAAQKPPATS